MKGQKSQHWHFKSTLTYLLFSGIKAHICLLLGWNFLSIHVFFQAFMCALPILEASALVLSQVLIVWIPLCHVLTRFHCINLTAAGVSFVMMRPSEFISSVFVCSFTVICTSSGHNFDNNTSVMFKLSTLSEVTFYRCDWDVTWMYGVWAVLSELKVSPVPSHQRS